MDKSPGGLYRPCFILWSLLTTVTVMGASPQCFDWKGDPVKDGTSFIPKKEDPCTECTCDNGFMIMCHSVTCVPPPNKKCKRLEEVEGECCKTRCLDPPGHDFSYPNPDNSTAPDGTAVDDDSITNLGLRLVASTVTSFLVLALLLFMVHRLRQRRLLLAMRRFQAQARRQQLEEADSDQYIPENFTVIDCPPYQDPPPPYSPPKPHPRILPGEAPPPYSEFEQNLSGNNNNNQSSEVAQDGSVNSTSQRMIENRSQDEARNAPGNQDHGGSRVNAQLAVFNDICQVERDQRQTSSSNSIAKEITCESEPISHRYSSNSTVDSSEVRSDGCGLREGSSSGEVHKDHLGNSLGRASGSSMSCESHNCSCDSEQTLLKKSYCTGQAESRQSQTLPTGFSVNTDLASNCSMLPGRKNHPRTHSQTTKTGKGPLQNYLGNSWSPADSSHSLTRESCSQNASPKYSSLPPEFPYVREPLRTGSAPTMDADIESISPYQNTSRSSLPPNSSNRSSSPNTCVHTDMSQSCVVMRERKPKSQQEELRKSLPPLDFPHSFVNNSTKSDNPAASESNKGRTNGNQSKLENSEHQILRNIRLSNLWNSPTASFDGPVSPISPTGKPVRRSHSVTSDISIFSICSETGEKKSARNISQALRNDSQYPEIPISAHAMRVAAAFQAKDNSEREKLEQGMFHPVSSVNLANGCQSDCKGTSPNHASLNPIQRQADQRESSAAVSRLNAIKENSIELSSHGHPSQMVNNCEASTTLKNQEKETVSPKVPLRSRKREKQKPCRHSTGSVLLPKPKRHNHLTSTDQKETQTESVRKSDVQVENPVANSSKTLANGAKADSSKKKMSKPVGGSFKQYGFIDDPNFIPSRNGIVEPSRIVMLEEVDSPKGIRKSGLQTERERSTSAGRNAATQSKMGVKRHLTNADKSSYSPSPTRQKSSRPRSLVQTNPKGSAIVVSNSNSQNSSPNQNVPRRKMRNTSRSKKRQSCPTTQSVQVNADCVAPSIQDCTSHFTTGTRQASDRQNVDRNTSGNAVAVPNGTVHSGSEQGQAETNPTGLITVRNGPLSSYV